MFIVYKTFLHNDPMCENTLLDLSTMCYWFNGNTGASVSVKNKLHIHYSEIVNSISKWVWGIHSDLSCSEMIGAWSVFIRQERPYRRTFPFSYMYFFHTLPFFSWRKMLHPQLPNLNCLSFPISMRVRVSTLLDQSLSSFIALFLMLIAVCCRLSFVILRESKLIRFNSSQLLQETRAYKHLNGFDNCRAYYGGWKRWWREAQGCPSASEYVQGQW